MGMPKTLTPAQSSTLFFPSPPSPRSVSAEHSALAREAAWLLSLPPPTLSLSLLPPLLNETTHTLPISSPRSELLKGTLTRSGVHCQKLVLTITRATGIGISAPVRNKVELDMPVVIPGLLSARRALEESIRGEKRGGEAGMRIVRNALNDARSALEGLSAASEVEVLSTEGVHVSVGSVEGGIRVVVRIGGRGWWNQGEGVVVVEAMDPSLIALGAKVRALEHVVEGWEDRRKVVGECMRAVHREKMQIDKEVEGE